jgi:hypothetical protein
MSIVLFATYLYSKPDYRQAIPVRIAQYEMTRIDGNPSDFDEHVPSALAKSSLRSEAIGTSRPETPNAGKHHFRAEPGRKNFSKRDE